MHTGENRGVKQAGFMVLTTARRPAILVEMGYSTNPQDGRLLTTRASQTAMASAIADAIVSYLREYERKDRRRRRFGRRAVTIGIRLRRVPALALVVGLLAGCCTTTGCTTPTGSSARPGKRNGRIDPFEASGPLGTVITRAESVLSAPSAQRIPPRSRRASPLGALPPQPVPAGGDTSGPVALLPPGDFAEEAVLALGRCQMETGDPVLRRLAFRPFVDIETRYTGGRRGSSMAARFG